MNAEQARAAQETLATQLGMLARAADRAADAVRDTVPGAYVPQLSDVDRLADEVRAAELALDDATG